MNVLMPVQTVFLLHIYQDIKADSKSVDFNSDVQSGI